MYIQVSTEPPPPHHNHFTALFRDHPGEPVPEENFWTLRCKGRLTEAYTVTIRLGVTPSGLTSAHLHHPPIFFTGRMPFLPSNQQRQSTEGNQVSTQNCTQLITYLVTSWTIHMYMFILRSSMNILSQMSTEQYSVWSMQKEMQNKFICMMHKIKTKQQQQQQQF